MAKNLGREFATMDEDERRRFAMTPEGGASVTPEELDFENPRDQRDAEPGDREGVARPRERKAEPGGD
jgi:hypothetical protein